MIGKTTPKETTVFHEVYGMGKFIGYETKEDHFKGYAAIRFNNYPGIYLIHPKNLTEIEV